jgi:hypothetical protein
VQAVCRVHFYIPDVDRQMLKRGSGARHLPMFSNTNSRAARVGLLKQTHNNNIMGINVFENAAPNAVRATPSPTSPADTLHAIRGASPALAARSVRYKPGANRKTFNVKNAEEPLHRASAFGKQKLEPLKMTRRSRSSRRRNRRQTRRRN